MCILVSLWYHYDVIIVHLWHYHGIILVLLWCHCGIIIASLWYHYSSFVTEVYIPNRLVEMILISLLAFNAIASAQLAHWNVIYKLTCPTVATGHHKNIQECSSTYMWWPRSSRQYGWERDTELTFPETLSSIAHKNTPEMHCHLIKEAHRGFLL